MTDVAVEELAALARLSLDEEETRRLTEEVGGILEHMAALQELNTEGVEPMTHAVTLELRLRPDDAKASFGTETALAAAPDHTQDCFRVPNVIKKQ